MSVYNISKQKQIHTFTLNNKHQEEKKKTRNTGQSTLLNKIYCIAKMNVFKIHCIKHDFEVMLIIRVKKSIAKNAQGT